MVKMTVLCRSMEESYNHEMFVWVAFKHHPLLINYALKLSSGIYSNVITLTVWYLCSLIIFNIISIFLFQLPMGCSYTISFIFIPFAYFILFCQYSFIFARSWFVNTLFVLYFIFSQMTYPCNFYSVICSCNLNRPFSIICSQVTTTKITKQFVNCSRLMELTHHNNFWIFYQLISLHFPCIFLPKYLSPPISHFSLVNYLISF